MWKRTAFFLVTAVVCSAGIYVGSRLYSVQDSGIEQKPEIASTELVKESAALNGDRITPSTIIVYEYYYTLDGSTQITEETAPYYLTGLRKEELEKKLEDWQILKFSSKEVVLHKNIEAIGERGYVIGNYDGFVAVFYEEPVDGESIMDITDTPISSLPEEEQIRIKSGIKIKGENELIKCMENLES